MLEIICMPMIVALVYALIELYKKAISGTKHAIFAKLIPIIACVLGVAAGTICYYCFPELIAAHNLATAMLIGAASGLSATGCNQIFKQLKQYSIEVNEPNQESTPQQASAPNEIALNANTQNEIALNVSAPNENPLQENTQHEIALNLSTQNENASQDLNTSTPQESTQTENTLQESTQNEITPQESVTQKYFQNEFKSLEKDTLQNQIESNSQNEDSLQNEIDRTQNKEENQ